MQNCLRRASCWNVSGAVARNELEREDLSQLGRSHGNSTEGISLRVVKVTHLLGVTKGRGLGSR